MIRESEARKMDLQGLTVTDIKHMMTVYSKKGSCASMTDRKCYGLSLCIEGQITYIQNGRAYVSKPGYAVFLPKGATYLIQKDKTGYFPVINFDCLEPLCDTITVIPVRNADALISDYERMKKLFCFDRNRAQIFSIFYGMLHAIDATDLPHELAGAMRMIRNDYSDPSLTNARLATECHMSEVYFRKLFVKYFHTSPKQFIIDLRIQMAKQMLSEGFLSVSAISERCGFSNSYHFCRLFKQHTGKTPSEYRKANLIYEA